VEQQRMLHRSRAQVGVLGVARHDARAERRERIVRVQSKAELDSFAELVVRSFGPAERAEGRGGLELVNPHL
jgi:hypothetical protein